MLGRLNQMTEFGDGCRALMIDEVRNFRHREEFKITPLRFVLFFCSDENQT
jgi:hypothetical protein